MDSREQGLSVDGKEIEFPTTFARFVHRRKKMCRIIFTKKSAKSDYPCLVYAREKIRQFRDYMKKREKILLTGSISFYKIIRFKSIFMKCQLSKKRVAALFLEKIEVIFFPL